MIPTLSSAPTQTARSVPRVPNVPLNSGIAEESWPPLPEAIAFTLEQPWRAKPDLAYRPGAVWLAATKDTFLICAELNDEYITTSAKADHQRIWDLGDSFEIFLRPAHPETGYFEFQVASSGHVLQLAYPKIGASRAQGVTQYIVREPLITSVVRLDPDRNRWRIMVRVSIAALSALIPGCDGGDWQIAFCRYDYDAEGNFCLSSSANFTKVDFHRVHEWSSITVKDGFPTVALPRA